MIEEIEPCPFCEAKQGCKEADCLLCSEEYVCVVSSYGDQKSYVFCSYCGASGPVSGSRHAAITAWNTRPLEAALQAQIDALKKQLRTYRLVTVKAYTALKNSKPMTALVELESLIEEVKV